MTDRKAAQAARAGDHGDPRDELVDHLPALRAFALSLTRDGEELVAVTRQMLRQWNEYRDRKRNADLGGENFGIRDAGAGKRLFVRRNPRLLAES